MITKEQEIILAHTRDKVRALFAEKQPIAHDADHSERVEKWIRSILWGEYKYNKEVHFLSRMAAWLHDIGRTKGNKNHWDHSYVILLEWFKKDDVLSELSTKRKRRLLYAVVNHWNDEANDFPEAFILRDADKLECFGESRIRRLREFYGDDEEILLFHFRFNYQLAAQLKTKTARRIL